MPRHAPPDRDRLGAALTASWIAGHLAVIPLLGVAVEQDAVRPFAAPAAASPDIEPDTA
ncbi:hypothetical protein [Kitasatospora sp. NPDC093558]|uniref:hypothetical protein n=1 Tax=Kitasatospora sp. NPDC093558 TaxID=3155201 RepID=UPI00344171B7